MEASMIALAWLALAVQDPAVPEGYEISRVAEPPLVERPIMAGLDDRGRLYVADSSGVNLRIDDLVKAPPHRIVRLEDSDGDGRFDRSVVFAEGMTFPMGALWHRGALYVCAPPSVWRLRDTDGDGRADERTELVTKFGSNGNAADVHGPFLHPSGRLWWSDGRHGHNIRRADGSIMEGKAARIFRMKPDGSEVEVVCGGGMDNPVEIAFTEEGEALATVALLHSQPRRIDAIIHCVEGGVFPYHECVKEFKRTGDLLPSVVDVGWVAPSGLVRTARGEWFSAHFNTHKVQRHVIERDGASFRGRNEDFLVSENPDFHPTDVLEDADGSLLVLDTGGWFRIGCPTSRVDKPQIKGAIYRVRKKGAPRATAAAPSLDDPCPERAIDALALKGDVGPLEGLLRESPSARARRNAVWSLTRIESAEARKAVREALRDRDPSVRLAAAHSVGLYRDREAVAALLKILRDDVPHVVREAATALGRIQDKAAVPELFLALRAGTDRFLEHALLYAAIEIADREGTLPYLKDEQPLARRAALIALDQMEGGALAREQVTPLLDPAAPQVQKAALAVLAARGWSGEVLGLLRGWLAEEQPRPELEGIVTGFARDAGVQDLVALALRNPATSTELRLVLLETMARAPLDRLPPTWTAELRWGLDHADPRVVRQSVATVRAFGVADLDAPLLAIARDGKRPDELRAEAFAAAAPRVAPVEPAVFEFLRTCVAPDRPALLRIAAAQGIGSAPLSEPQLVSLAGSLGKAGALELPKLLGAWERSTSANAGRKLVAALEKAASFESLSAENLRKALQNQTDDVRAAASPLLKRLEVDTEAMKAKLAELDGVLREGDPARGRDVFLGPRAACTSCHALNGQGARVGPDLTKIGSIRTPKDLLEAVVFPSASFARGYEPWRLKTKDGAVYDGLIVRETADAITLLQADRQEKRVPRAAVDLIQQGKTSVMPQGLDQQLTRRELADLLAFLSSLR
jgi:putative heme-binding domain-containing protein